MRISQYKNILDLFDLVVEKIEYMEIDSSYDNIDDCNSAMKKIIEVVSLDEDNIQWIDILESISECFEKKLFYDDFIDDLLNIKKLLENKLNYKYKVLFIAELGGKWDAMDSVYRAFSSREDCEVSVVIEPVFREVLLEDGSTKKEIVYKDFLSDMGIKHILFNKYDISKEKPDITFISQPYESCTLPMFWPENIAKYSRLVYLPYFTAITLNPVSTAFNSYFKLNTQKYSWKTPCQSELMKNYFKKYASNRGRNILVTGLPKWDFPINLKEEDYPIPETWKQKIKGKKVFLWNTHFSVDICGSQLLTNRVWDFLDIFSENQEIALIWRPHPMLDTVIKVYYGEKEINKYEKIKSFILASENMVIDEFGTYAYSFLYSDALISDFSTLIEQYLFMNKPILMLTAEKVETEREKFKSDDGLFDYNKILFSDNIKTTSSFIESVVMWKSSLWEEQKFLLNTYFPLADGQVGKRLSNILLNDLYNELFNNEFKKIKTDFLIIGSLEESIPCIKQLSDKCADLYICDMFLKNDDCKEIEESIFKLERITEYDFKSVIITSKNNSEFIKHILNEEFGVNYDDIIDFWNIYNAAIPLMVCDRVLKNPKTNSYEGLIIGLSRTEVGIIPALMDGRWCNLSVSSQDLFYQLQTLKYCLSEYSEKFEKLEYAVIELYDYHYFNYDTSMGKTVLNYWNWGGFNKSLHNYSLNNNFDLSYDDVINKIKNDKYHDVTPKHAEIWNEFLSDIYQYTDYKEFATNTDIYNRTKIVSDYEIENYDYERNSVTKIHDETISENKAVFEEMLNTLLSYNPKMHIYTVLLPKYCEVEKRDVNLVPLHEEYFNKIIVEMKEKYNFIHLNFKELMEISENRNCFFDAEHFNIYGAYKFTNVLKNIIKSGKE